VLLDLGQEIQDLKWSNSLSASKTPKNVKLLEPLKLTKSSERADSKRQYRKSKKLLTEEPRSGAVKPET